MSCGTFLSTRAQPSDPLLICFSHLRWNFVYQRPQHLLSRAARSYQVFFIEEPRFETGTHPRLNIEPQDCGVQVITPILPQGSSSSQVISAQRTLLDQLLIKKPKIDISWYYTPIALEFSSYLKANLCIYDCMDQLAAFIGAPKNLTLLEQKLFAKSDLVFTGGLSLYEAKRCYHRNVHAFPSSIDKAHFHQARKKSIEPPQDQATLPHPRLGFFGVIDERMNLNLLDQAAAMRPNWQFILIGPIAKINPSLLPCRTNIHWLGLKAYSMLPNYLAGWDIGIMPFALNEATRFISPTKTPEFLAAGVPVLSTPIADVIRPYGDAGLVEIITDAHELIHQAEHLLTRSHQSWLQKVDRHLADYSWDKTWNQMRTLINKELTQVSSAKALPKVNALDVGGLHV